MTYYNSPNPIYEFHYTKYITNDPFYIGKDVKVVKGRKYPIGSVYKIKSFWTYYINQWNKTDYAIMETGEKININNLELVKAKINYHIKESWFGGHGDVCPNCNGDKIRYCGSGYDGVMDLYIGHAYCQKCGLELRYRDL